MIASSEGGVNIEEVAERNPDAIVKTPIDITQGLSLATAKVAKQKGKSKCLKIRRNLVCEHPLLLLDVFISGV